MGQKNSRKYSRNAFTNREAKRDLAYSLPLDAAYAVRQVHPWALRHPEEVAAYRAEVEERAREAEARAQALLARLGRLRQGG